MERDIEEKIRTLRGAYRGENNLDPLPAVLGDAAGNVTDPTLPGNVYVRVQTSNGLSDRRSVRAPGTMLPYLKPGLPVLLGQDQFGRRTIIGVNNDALLSAGNSPVTVQMQSTSTGTVQADLETLRLVPTSPPSLTVCLKSYRDIVGATEYDMPGVNIDLTSSVPSAGDMLYAVIGVKNDYLTTEVAVSTARGLADVPLALADRNEAIALLTAGSNPTWAVKLVGGQTEVTEQDIKQDAVDLRRVVNGPPTYTQEFRVSALGVANGASAPTSALRAIGASGNLKVPVLQFSKVTQQDVYFEIHAPYDLINSYNVEFHVMVFPGAAWTTGNFMLKLEYLVKDEYSGSTATGAPTTIQYDYTPGAATDIAELEYASTIDLNLNQTLMCHFYRDVANDNGDDVISVRFFEINYTARTG